MPTEQHIRHMPCQVFNIINNPSCVSMRLLHLLLCLQMVQLPSGSPKDPSSPTAAAAAAAVSPRGPLSSCCSGSEAEETSDSLSEDRLQQQQQQQDVQCDLSPRGSGSKQVGPHARAAAYLAAAFAGSSIAIKRR
mgnify:CR=1 FL=1